MLMLFYDIILAQWPAKLFPSMPCAIAGSQSCGGHGQTQLAFHSRKLLVNRDYKDSSILNKPCHHDSSSPVYVLNLVVFRYI